MKKRLLIVVLAAASGTLALCGTAIAHGDHSQHYGPYPSSSPDSGTCGNDWATDIFDRFFTVNSNGNGTFTVKQQFLRGRFVTFAGPSPGSCDPNDGTPPGVVAEGVVGDMGGYFIISNVGAQTSNSPYCNALLNTNLNCTTTTFINTHFTPCYPVTCTVTTFNVNYFAVDQSLIDHYWRNASANVGGNQGDIRSAP